MIDTLESSEHGVYKLWDMGGLICEVSLISSKFVSVYLTN